ncbi:MAG: hypothetical protein ABIT20_23505 [Gemmatimonadaceae bacterium]
MTPPHQTMRTRIEAVDVVRGLIMVLMALDLPADRDRRVLSLSKQTPRQLSRFLLTRGLWLIVLEVVVLRFFMQFNVDYRVTMLTVLWALGCAMITLSALVFLRPAIVAAFGLVLIVGHNLLDGIQSAIQSGRSCTRRAFSCCAASMSTVTRCSGPCRSRWR